MDQNLGEKRAPDATSLSQADNPDKKVLPIADSAQLELDPEQQEFLGKLASGRLTPDDMKKLMAGAVTLDGNVITIKFDGNGNEAVVHELGGRQSLIADRMIADATNSDLKYKVYALVGLDKLTLDSKAVVLPPPDSDFNVGLRSDAFKHARHLKQMAQAYALFFDTPMGEGELKKD